MRRFRVLSLLMVLVIMLSSVCCYAYYDYNADGLSIEEASKDPKYWYQGTVPSSDNVTLGNTGKTPGAAACGYFSASAILVKMGIMNPEEDNPIELIKWANENYTERMYGQESGYWHINPWSIPSRYPDFEFEVLHNEEKSDSCYDLKGDELKSWVKGVMNEGYFVALTIPRTAGGAHWIAVDGFDEEGNMIIFDSYYNATTEPKKYEDANNYGSYGSYSDYGASDAMLFKMEGVDPLSAPSIYGGTFNISVSDEDIEEYNRLVKEWELNGMPTNNDLLTGEQDALYLPTQDGLTQSEKDTLVEIKANIDDNKKTSANIFSTILTFLGLVLMSYSILMFAGCVVDRVNTWIDMSVVSILSFGKIRLVPQDEEHIYKKTKPEKGLLTTKQWVMRCIAVLVIGIIFVSGAIQEFLTWVLLKIKGL